MPILSAETSFRSGLAALRDGNHPDAERFFRRSLTIERDLGFRRPRPRYLSFFGLSVARGGGSIDEAIESCVRALRADPSEPDFHLNLARVYVEANRITAAARTLARGLRRFPGHPGMRAELARLDRRDPPPLVFLDRGHAANRVVGKLRARTREVLGRRAIPSESVSAV